MKKSANIGSKLAAILFVGFFLILCLTIGVGTIYLGIRDIVYTKSSLYWPHTNGKVVSSSIIKSTPSRTGNSPAGSLTFQADIEYEYIVKNKTLKNYRISYGDFGSSDESLAKGIVSRYPIGKMVTVYYEPDNPSESVLEPEGTKKGSILKIIVGSVFLFFGVLIALFPYLARKIKNNLTPQIKPKGIL